MSIQRLPTDQIELGAPPIKTDKGWLLVYSHIQRYGAPDQIFGIEILLLDKNNPKNIIGRTKGPIMSPEAYYEMVGQVPRIVFPSGAYINKEHLEIYYGSADTHCAMATVPLDNLLKSLVEDKPVMKRYPGNPIIVPRPGYIWEAKGTFNPASIDIGGNIHIFYRAVAEDGISTMGYAKSADGLSIDERSDKPVYFPRADFESRGCEDARLMEIEDRIYMTYTGYDGSTPRVTVTSISKPDFLKKRWSAWSKPEVITPPSIANKDSAILPEKVKGGYLIFHRVNESICADYVSTLDFSKEKITQCIEVVTPRRGMWDGGKVGLSTPPIKTKEGWLLLYHGVSWSTTYRIGAVLLDLEDPTIIKARTAVPIFEPETEYEQKGIIPNVVFPCGLAIRGQNIYMYYGAADLVTGVAMMKLSNLIKMLQV